MLPLTWEPFSRLHPFAPVGPGRGLSAGHSTSSRTALCADHRLRGRVAAAELGRAGRVRRAARHSRLPPQPRRRPPHRGADPGVGARHQPGERRAGRTARRGRGQRAPTAAWTSAICRAKAAEHADTLACLMITYPSTHGVFEAGIRDICDLVHRARRAGLHGRRQHERAGGADQPGAHRRRRVPPEPAQDLRDPARRRRARHGADCGGAAPGAVPARPSGRAAAGRGDAAGLGGAVGERQHPAGLARLRLPARAPTA